MVFRQQVEGRLKVIELQHLGHMISLERIRMAQDEITGLLPKICEAPRRKPKTKEVVASSTPPPRPSVCNMFVELFGSDSSMD